MVAVALVLAWILVHFGTLTSTQNGFLRFTLTAVFSLLILLRPKRLDEGSAPRPRVATGFALAGLFLAVGGVVFIVRQVEWIGVLCILFAVLRWSLPSFYGPDLAKAILFLYWAHPLPSRLFGALQLAMQQASVRGSEWMLHLFNVRVWADGLVLRTGLTTYEVPSWCSGMRAATTVLLLAVGLGLLKRLPPRPIAILAAAAVLQALVLNILRIAAMVVFTPRIGGTGIGFLHDTAGLIVVASVFVVYLELVAWDRHRRRAAAVANDSPAYRSPLVSEHPVAWRWLLDRAWHLGALLLAVTALSGALYRSRPYHRAQMLKDVANGLRDTGRLEEAQRCANVVARLAPEDREWHMTMIRLLLIRGRFKEVVEALDALPPDVGSEIERRVLRAYALTFMNRLGEAADIVMELPEPVRANDPRIAMILAEMSFRADDPEAVARHLEVAARWRPNTARIRVLFPYLREHRLWETIGAADEEPDFAETGQIMTSIEAAMNLNRPDRVADLVSRALIAWPDDPRAIEPLYFMAVRRWDTPWEAKFADQLGRCLPRLRNPAELGRLLQQCFDLYRPDLGWRVMRRMQALDPRHPSVPLGAARYAPVWFTFRKRYLEINAPSPTESIDLKPFFLLGTTTGRWRPLCDAIPYGARLAVEDAPAAARAVLAEALAEFERLEREGALPIPLEYEYAFALDMADRVEEARRRLAALAQREPAERWNVVNALSEIAERRGDWQGVYESLREYVDNPQPNLNVLLRLCRAQINLRLGLGSIRTARLAMARFPRSTLASSALALALSRHDSAEEALLVLSRPRLREEREADIIEADALYATQRFVEADAFCRASLLPRPPIPPDTPQRALLPPAELAALWHRVAIPSSADFEANAAALRRNLPETTSPFLHGLLTRWLAAYDHPDDREAWTPALWSGCGRDPVERAAALNQLTILLCWRERFADARAAAEAATGEYPAAAVLWRGRISLSGADPAVIAAARAACPADSEIWLADVVERTQRPGLSAARGERKAPDWLLADLTDAARAERWTPAAMTRAGEYLLRIGMADAAALAARDATRRARGLLPAYVLGIRCALKTSDRAWALSSAKEAVTVALQPPAGLYRTMVDFKSSDAEVDTDPDMVQALTRLRSVDPDNPLWAQMLGYVRFRRGGWEAVDSIYQMTAAIDGGATNRVPYVVAAEAARMLGNNGQAAEWLHKGLALHPDDPTLLNNLIFVLAQTPISHAEALSLLPRLEALAGADPAALDTMAVTYLRSGRLDLAEATLQRVQRLVPSESRAWFRAQMYMAEIAIARGSPTAGRVLIEGVLQRSKGLVDEDLAEANRIRGLIKQGAPQP